MRASVVSCVKVTKCGNTFTVFTTIGALSLTTCAHMRSVSAGAPCSSLTNYNFRSELHFSQVGLCLPNA